MLNSIKEFLKLEAAGGIVLFAAAVLAMVVANSPLASLYELFVNLPVAVRIGPLEIAKPWLLWINDGLMAVFFFLVGLELKREVLEGELSELGQIVLPALAALGGMLVPALVYVAFNHGDAVSLGGWAIPAATDIAFALGILSLLGDRVPVALKVFLVSVAIFDDLGAIVIIAVFYTSDLSLTALAISLACLPVLYLLNRRGVTRLTPYLFIGLIMWVAVLKSGVHATLAGVALALFIPMRDPADPERSPLRNIEHDLHGTIAFCILPLFAFANSGIALAGVGLGALAHPVSLGVGLGLLLGKQIGVFGFSWLGIRLGLAKLPEGSDWRALYGVAMLCGIGFTMSLFIGSLAFAEDDVERIIAARLGIIGGSLLSGLAGYLLLRRALVLPPRSR